MLKVIDLQLPAPAISDAARQSLQLRVQGDVIVPGDTAYDSARSAWNLTVQQYPAVIVIANNAQDVAEAVRFAREEGLGIAVQSTGHGVTLPADESLLIVTSRMTNVRINAEAQTAYVEAGVKWGMVLEKAQAFGLAPLLGSSPDVGVVGYTLGGGFGWLARKYGLATDSVQYFDVVTGTGSLVRASADENSDLSWGLRGGGGSFGVVVGMKIRLYPVSTVFAGNLIYPAAQAKEALTRYREWIKTAPEELTSGIAIMNFPPMPGLPPFLSGKSVIMVRGCFTGSAEDGQALIQPWLDWQAPIANMFVEMPFTLAGTISNDPVDPMPGVTSGGLWLNDLTDEAIDILVRYSVAQNGPNPLVMTEIRHGGGAIQRANRQAAAFTHRDGSLLMGMVGMAPTPEAHANAFHYMEQAKAELQPFMAAGLYINFVEGQEARKRTSDAYSPETYRRLQVVKAKYDPENLFRYSYNIPPAKNG